MNRNNKHSERARVRWPQRLQKEMRICSLDELLPEDHRARLVVAYVDSLDLSLLYSQLVVSENQAGRTAIAREVLVSLWLLATLDGIGSARELARRCETDLPYMWICGGVQVNYHTLSDFRSGQAEFLEKVLVDSVAAMINSGLVPMETIAQDGMRVRANAGKSSFRRKPTLEKLQAQAQEHLENLKRQSESTAERQQANARKEAAALRAAEERKARIDEALKQHEKLAQAREKRVKGSGQETRVSTTDPDARTMKMANGGYDPAFNVQFATDADTRMIVAVDVTNEGTDGGQLDPMHKRITENYARTPHRMLVDSAFATKEGVTSVETRGTEIVSTIPRSEQLERHGKDPHARQKGDTDAYFAFRQRMSQKSYQELYGKRPSVAEFPNANCRNRNLRQFPVRGLVKVKAVALWHVIAFNFLRQLNLGVIPH